MIRAGLLSTAGINYNGFILPILKRHDVVIDAIASRCALRAAAFSQKYGIPKFYGSYQQLLDDSDLDMIYISTPNAFHAQWALKALEAGKHVLCEKPISYTYQDALKLRDYAKSKGRIIFDALHYHYHPAMISLFDQLQHGYLGKINYIDVHLGYPLPPEGDIRYQPWVLGGAFMHMGCYCGHFILHSLGSGRLDIADLYSKRHPNGADTLSRGRVISDQHDGEFWFRASLLEKNIQSRIYIRGTKGEMVIHEPFNPVVINGFDCHDTLCIHSSLGRMEDGFLRSINIRISTEHFY